MINWKQVNDGPKWVPILNAAEDKYAIPTDMLARQAFEESSFLPEVISGAKRSPAGAVGIMQLMPEDFPGAGQDPVRDIDTAANYLASLAQRFSHDWQVALAAYDWGPGNVHRWLAEGGPLPTETLNYVKQIVADVPVGGQIIACEGAV